MYELRKGLLDFYRRECCGDEFIGYNVLKAKLNKMIEEGVEEYNPSKNKRTYIYENTVIQVNTKENLIVWIGGRDEIKFKNRQLSGLTKIKQKIKNFMEA